jgi:hypothetical protein
MSDQQVFAASLTKTSATYTDLATTKNALRFDGQNIYRLAKAGEALTKNTILKFSAYDGTANTAGGGMTVVMTTACADTVVGCTQVAVTDTHYFWMMVKGIAVLTGDLSVAAGEKIMPQATGPGIVDTYVSLSSEGAVGGNTFCGIALEDDAATTGYVVCLFEAGAAGSSLA